MKLATNPVAAQVSQYLMKAALPLGLFFIVEYMIGVAAAHSTTVAMLRVPLMVVTPIALFVALRNLRDRILSGMIGGFQAWVYGVQLMLFAALIEAAFIYVYNEFIVPDNLYATQQAALAQIESVLTQTEEMPNPSARITSMVNLLREAMQQMADAPVATPIQAAINQVSSDLFIAMFLMLFIAPAVKRKMPK